LELLDADVLLDEERRHRAALAAKRGARLDRLGPRPDVFVRDQRHRCDAARVMAFLAAALQDRRNVPGEGDLARRARGLGARGGPGTHRNSSGTSTDVDEYNAGGQR